MSIAKIKWQTQHSLVLMNIQTNTKVIFSGFSEMHNMALNVHSVTETI